MNPTVFALLDDRESTPARPTSRLYTGFVREHRCEDAALLDAVWAQVEADQAAGLQAVLLADYEWGAQLVGAGHRPPEPGQPPWALRVLMFERLERLSREAAGDWLVAQEAREDAATPWGVAAPGGGPLAESPGPAGITGLQGSLDRDAFHRDIETIREAIRKGETYQVNYTYRLHFAAHGTPAALYRRLRARQPVRYGAYLALPAVPGFAGAGPSHVLSCSPELFVRIDGGRLIAQPMKGTARREFIPEGDSETARGLHEDVKNRAENLMIVDLLRNDLSRIAEVGTVKVPALFAVEAHATVFQMTSTIEARPRAGLTMPELLRALYPCGSITGAPKHQTMKLIRSLEGTPRGLYTGAIGWFEPPAPGASLGSGCLSVAIRTLTLDAPRADGLRSGRLGIGAGIVLDSEPEAEYQECRLKGRFLTGLEPGFTLFETLHATRREGIRHRAAHLDRLARSADALGFAFDRAAAEAALDAALGLGPTRLPAELAGSALAEPPPPDEAGRLDSPRRLRLDLHPSGRLDTRSATLAPLPAALHDAQGRIRLRRAALALPDLPHPLAAHKTSRRQHYDDAVRAAEAADAFDALFFTADGRLVEGGRSSVFVQLDGRWYTPPVADGALPGVMRAALLADPALGARERSITAAELARAEALIVCNALRGALAAVFEDGAAL
ncbi:chorismate-binding protein [Aquariibacter albus]|uniref:Bifunctional anthranilate synthase component I family protein/class IV aminotransferase n=1 Tax=Aquariibacter albus TaxID=2759899 RepID=A0A839HJ94_9BURK|nr:bifunctional anthranilate synthase component I family protein/class IV aminotransferase [Aquariibacter albus]MBB1161626.1 bifunctional anthranilate synthase component I family protein/class IV aminotransferase [Aquariibacter albus]